MKATSKHNKGYDYLSSRINSFLLKGYSSVWHRVAFHVLFWVIMFFLDFIIALFKWQGEIPKENALFMCMAKTPTIFFFYFCFYETFIKSSGLRFFVGFVIFYIATHWLHLISLYIVLQNDHLIKLNTVFIRAYSKVSYFDFFNPNALYANIYSVVIGFFPIGIKFAYDLYRTSIQKQVLETESTKAELSYLRNQINPHFIFNTINNAYYYVFKKDKDSAELLLKLSNIIRYTIEETGEDTIPLEKEITILQDLINIEKIRSSTHALITYTQELENSNIAAIKILPLALVTLLENAIKHGVGTNYRSGFVDCHLKVTVHKIDFRIINSVNINKAENSAGIGLRNLKRRLDLIYGDNHKLICTEKGRQYTAQLTIELT